MEFKGSLPVNENLGAPGQDGFSRSAHPGTQTGSQNPSKVSGLAGAPKVTKDLGSSLPRNVLSERVRRRRISKSCDRLRVLLPYFDGRREDMASVLEMVVQFLQLAHTLTPDQEQLSMNYKQISAQRDVLQLTKASQVEDSKPDPGTAAAEVTLKVQSADSAEEHRVTRHFPGLREFACEMLDMDQSEVLGRISELLERPPFSPGQDSGVNHEDGMVSSPEEPASLWPGFPPSLPQPWQSTSPETRELVAGELCQMAFLVREDESLGSLAEEANVELTPVPDNRYTEESMGCNVDDELAFLLNTSSDWWMGSVESSRDPALSSSSPVDGAEPGFLMDPKPSSQQLPLEPWGLDLEAGTWL